mgnify:CR=1 FL=1
MPIKIEDYLYGVNPVMSAIYSKRRNIYELMVTENPSTHYANLKFTLQGEENYRIQNIISQAYKLKIPVKQMHKVLDI